MVQTMAEAAVRAGWRLVVLEAVGHGLSSGARGVCGSFAQLVTHAVGFITEFDRDLIVKDRLHAPFAQRYQHRRRAGRVRCRQAARRCGLQLTARRCRALRTLRGVSPEAVPPRRSTLRFVLSLRSRPRTLAWLKATPYEDPSSYNAPSESTRNYRGHWPLATCRMLVDVCEGVAADQAQGALALRFPIIAFSGAEDHVIPVGAVSAFVEAAESADKQFVLVDGSDRQLLSCRGGGTASRGPQLAAEALEWLDTWGAAIYMRLESRKPGLS